MCLALMGRRLPPGRTRPLPCLQQSGKQIAPGAPPFDAWLERNRLDGADIEMKKFDQELFGIQQAMAENGLVFCSTTLAARLSKNKLLQQFETQSVESNLCYYVPNKDSFETRAAVRFLKWLEDILRH